MEKINKIISLTEYKTIRENNDRIIRMIERKRDAGLSVEQLVEKIITKIRHQKY